MHSGVIAHPPGALLDGVAPGAEAPPKATVLEMRSGWPGRRTISYRTPRAPVCLYPAST